MGVRLYTNTKHTDRFLYDPPVIDWDNEERRQQDEEQTRIKHSLPP